MRRIAYGPAALLLALAGACSDSPTEPLSRDPVAAEAPASIGVSSQADLQAALDAVAGGAAIRTIRLDGDIALASALSYGGSQPLTLNGRGHTITGPTDDDAFRADGGGDLRFQNVRLEGAAAGASNHGIYAVVPHDATGTFAVRLDHVDLVGFGRSGLWVDDQVHDSPASVQVEIRSSRILENGGKPAASDALSDIEDVLDFDGVRTNEGGEGDIHLTIVDSEFSGNEADGYEGDEKGSGDILADVRNSVFSGNGAQSQDIRGCEAYPELEERPVECGDYPDREDGFDLDEDGEGGIFATLAGVQANDNVDEGVDLDELGNGDVHFAAHNLVAIGNKDENVKVTESDPEVDELEGVERPRGGSVIIDLSNVVADGSEVGRGARFEEFGDGDVRGSIHNSSFSNNTEDDGLRIDEADAGSIDVVLNRVEANGNDGQGLQVTENEEGDILLDIRNSEFTGNGNTAVELEEEDEGGHVVTIRGSTLVGEPGEKSLDVIEDGPGSGVVTIRGSTVSPEPVSSGDVTFN